MLLIFGVPALKTDVCKAVRTQGGLDPAGAKVAWVERIGLRNEKMHTKSCAQAAYR